METKLHYFCSILDCAGHIFMVDESFSDVPFSNLLRNETFTFCNCMFSPFAVWQTFRFPNFLHELLTVHRKCFAKQLHREWRATPPIKGACMFVKTKVALDMRSKHWLLNNLFFSCDIDNKNIESFQLLFIFGMFIAIIAMASTFYMKKIAPKTLVCKLITTQLCYSNSRLSVILCAICLNMYFYMRAIQVPGWSFQR